MYATHRHAQIERKPRKISRNITTKNAGIAQHPKRKLDTARVRPTSPINPSAHQDVYVRASSGPAVSQQNNQDSLASLIKPTLDHLQKTLDELPQHFENIANKVYHPINEAMSLAHELTKPPVLTRSQKIAAALEKWMMPITQILLGAAIILLGVSTMNVGHIVLGVMTCVAGLATSIKYLADMIVPRLKDRVREHFEHRKANADAEPQYNKVVMLDEFN